MTHRSKTIAAQMNVLHVLNDARNDLKKVSPQHAAIDQVISAVTGLLTEEDKKIMLPVAVKDKIKKLIGLTIQEPDIPKSWIARTFHKKMTITEYRYRLALLSTCLVTFIHSYK